MNRILKNYDDFVNERNTESTEMNSIYEGAGSREGKYSEIDELTEKLYLHEELDNLTDEELDTIIRNAKIVKDAEGKNIEDITPKKEK